MSKMHSISSLHVGRGGGVVAAVEETDVSAIGGGDGGDFFGVVKETGQRRVTSGK